MTMTPKGRSQGRVEGRAEPRGKLCSRCGETKPPAGFYKQCDRRDGLSTHCRDCIRIRHNNYENTDGRRGLKKAYRGRIRGSEKALARERRHSTAYRARYPEKDKAKRELNRAVATGQITRPDKCDRCGCVPPRGSDGRTAIQGHHHNGYDKPLDVLWLCHACHNKEHSDV